MATQFNTSATGPDLNWARNTTGGPVSSSPFTVTLWALQQDGGAAANRYFEKRDSGGDTFLMYPVSSSTDTDLVWSANATGPARTAQTSGGLENGEWNCCTGVQVASDDRVARVDATTDNNTQNSSGHGAATQYSIGDNSGISFEGVAQNLASFNEELSSDQLESLEAGFHPFQVDPYSLVGFVPLSGSDPEADLVGGLDLDHVTVAGSGPVYADGRLIGGPSVV